MQRHLEPQKSLLAARPFDYFNRGWISKGSGELQARRILMQPQNKERFARLSALSPVDAVRAWLEGDFGLGDEAALLSAIRKDSRIKISDEEIEDFIMAAMNEELDADACFKHLTRS